MKFECLKIYFLGDSIGQRVGVKGTPEIPKDNYYRDVNAFSERFD